MRFPPNAAAASSAGFGGAPPPSAWSVMLHRCIGQEVVAAWRVVALRVSRETHSCREHPRSSCWRRAVPRETVLTEDIGMNIALPCRISVYEEDGQTKIATALPTKLLSALAASPALAAVAEDVETKMKAMMHDAA
jgi:hypothetical protein